jgi:hypothetical protein
VSLAGKPCHWLENYVSGWKTVSLAGKSVTGWKKVSLAGKPRHWLENRVTGWTTVSLAGNPCHWLEKVSLAGKSVTEHTFVTDA